MKSQTFVHLFIHLFLCLFHKCYRSYVTRIKVGNADTILALVGAQKEITLMLSETHMGLYAPPSRSLIPGSWTWREPKHTCERDHDDFFS